VELEELFQERDELYQKSYQLKIMIIGPFMLWRSFYKTK